MRRRALALHSSLSIRSGGADLLGGRRVALLEAIEATGSLTAAARRIGVSYKTAWDEIDAINNLARRPLVERRTGGRGGGGSGLTAQGRALTRAYRELEAAQQRHGATLGRRLLAPAAATLRALALRTSARNQLQGTVRKIAHGAVNSAVTLDLGDGLLLHSVITRASARELGLRRGRSAVALVKASLVVLAAHGRARGETGNALPGRIERMRAGRTQAEVQLRLAGGRTLTASVTRAAVRRLGLRAGAACIATVEPSHVLLAVTD